MSRVRNPDLDAFHELAQFEVVSETVRLLKPQYCIANHVVLLGRVPADPDGLVTAGMLNPRAAPLVQEVEKRIGRRVRPVRLNAYEIRRAIDLGWSDDPTAMAPQTATRTSTRPTAELSLAQDASVVRLLDELLQKSVELGASDLHIESYKDDVDVRVRVDGTMHQLTTGVTPVNVAAVVSRIKVLAALDIADRRVAQDGRISAPIEIGGQKRAIDFRVSVVPGPHGEDAVLRVLDGRRPLLGIDKLGLAEEVRVRLADLVTNPEGILLIAGPTGSGKTTTLYACLEELRRADRKIVTVEDPIEYHFAKVNQKQVSASMGFAAYTRAFVRQNPDVILVGEVRDEETAQAVLKAGQTGHLVLSTLHARDALSCIGRLDTLGIEPALVAASVVGILSQRLVRALCAECRVLHVPTSQEQRRLHLTAAAGPFYAPQGCEACRGTGYRGRVGVHELLVVGEAVAGAVSAEAPEREIRRIAREGGMQTLREDALAKAASGVTSLEELVRVMPYRLLEEADEIAPRGRVG